MVYLTIKLQTAYLMFFRFSLFRKWGEFTQENLLYIKNIIISKKNPWTENDLKKSLLPLIILIVSSKCRL